MYKIIGNTAISRRKLWVERILSDSGSFVPDMHILSNDLRKEIKNDTHSLIDHLRLCGHIPESYAHDSSQEKRYAKYTDILLSLAFEKLGFNSQVIDQRGDAADVEVFGKIEEKILNFVADAKAFRLSRSAKNQKDFKIQALANWKNGKPYAMLVAPIYQLPARTSQIYSQAISGHVLIFTYSHLVLLLRYASKTSKKKARYLLGEIFQTLSSLNPSKNAVDYWLSINKTMLHPYSREMLKLWEEEKIAAMEAVEIAKKEALAYLSKERERIINLDKDEAIKELLQMTKIEKKMNIISKIKYNKLLDLK